MAEAKVEQVLEGITEPKVLKIDSNILCFYLGRDATGPSPVAHIEGNWVDKDWEWGVCSYVIYEGENAFVFDTNVYPDQALWIRKYMEEKGVKNFLVANSHWHLDHIAGNEHFADCHIISSKMCRNEMIAVKDKVEAGEFWGAPALKVILPDIVFDDTLTLFVGEIEVQLRRYNIHTEDSLVAYLPAKKVCLCSDMLEDTVPFVLDIDDLAVQEKELIRLKELDVERFYPDHGDYLKIENGGYEPSFIDAVLEYERNLVGMHDRVDFAELPLDAFIPNALASGVLKIHDPYRSVHQSNVRLAQDYFAGIVGDNKHHISSFE